MYLQDFVQTFRPSYYSNGSIIGGSWTTIYDNSNRPSFGPDKRTDMSCVIFDQKLVMFGGRASYTIYNDLWFV